MIQRILYLTLAGALGTLSRYGLSGLVQRVAGHAFPWGTLAVNGIGCFLTGICWTIFKYHWPVSGEMRTCVLIGFMGAFTTFSTLILETGELFQVSEWLPGVGNLALHFGLGILGLFAGAAIARMA